MTKTGRQNSKKMRAKLRVAHHESGHAVVAFVDCSGPLGSVSILAIKTRGTLDWYSTGQTEVSFCLRADDPKPESVTAEQWDELVLRDIEEHVRVLLAGEAAQRIHSPQSVKPVHSAGDREMASALLSRVVPAAEVPARIATLMEEARALLLENWAAVEALASALVKRGYLGAKEVTHIICDVLNALESEEPTESSSP